MPEVAIIMMVVPIIIFFVIFAIVGAGNPTIEDGIDKMSTPYPTLIVNETLPDYCLNFIIDFWCFDPDDVPGWVTLFPQYVNVTLTRMDGFTETTAELQEPQSFTIAGQPVLLDSIGYIYGFLILIFAIGALLEFGHMIRGN